MNNSFVFNGTRTMYEQAGFEFVRPKGMKNTVMRRTIRPARTCPTAGGGWGFEIQRTPKRFPSYPRR
jgi:hypothetical protein